MKKFTHSGIIIYQFENIYINSNMYIILNGKEALVVDPNENNEAKKILKDNGIEKITILLTHEHFDHTMGIGWFQENYKISTICEKECAENIIQNIEYAPIFVNYIASTKNEFSKKKILDTFEKEFKTFSFNSDIVFENEYQFYWNRLCLKFLKIKGHSKGSCLIFLNDSIIFSGDSILNGIHIVTKLPGGNKKDFINKTIPVIESLDRNLMVFAGHGLPFVLSDVFKDDKLNVIIN